MIKRIFCLVLGVYILGCAKEREASNFVQTNLVHKALFEGEWYFARTIIDLEDEVMVSDPFGPFLGDVSRSEELYAIERIRWIIDKDYLYAVRVHEQVKGANKNLDDLLLSGGIVAVYRIKEHVDILRGYNSSTGEEINLMEEDTASRPWFEREYIRVDWSQNLVSGYYWNTLDKDLGYGGYRREPAPFFIQERDKNFPKGFYPRFEFKEGEIYYMSFVTQELWSPRENCEVFEGEDHCTTHMVTLRNSFLRVEDEEYEPLRLPNHVWERFGLLRLERPTYFRGDKLDPSEGLSRAYGETDLLDYLGARHNIFKEHWLKDEEGRILYDSFGRPLPLTPKEKAERGIKKIVYYLTKDFPAHLMREAFFAVSLWNEVLMKTLRILKGQPIPKEYDPFLKPNKEDLSRFYDCYIKAPPLPLKPTDPSQFSREIYLEFEGDECVFILKVNPCVRNPKEECKDLGDIRYNFIGYSEVVGPKFSGIAMPLLDPVTGRIVVANVMIQGPSLDLWTRRILDELALLEGSLREGEVLSGEDIRRYYERLGHVEHALGVVPSGDIAINPRKFSSSGEFIFNLLERAMERANMVRGKDGRMNILSDRLQRLKEKEIDSFLFDSLEGLVDLGGDLSESGNFSSSVFRLRQVFRKEIQVKVKMAEMLMTARSFVDQSVRAIARELRSLNLRAKERELFIKKRLFQWVLVHELGHVLGLDHNFAASGDYRNYAEEYYKIIDWFPWPQEKDFWGSDRFLDAEEASALYQARVYTQRMRDELLIKLYDSSSVMDHPPKWYGMMWPRLGAYDEAALSFAYGNLVEAFKGDPRVKGEIGIRPDRAKTVFWQYYSGGEVCRIDRPGALKEEDRGAHDEDCPYAKGSYLLASDQVITQTCGLNPRNPSSKKGVCRSFDEDFEVYVRKQEKKERKVDYYPRVYKFCNHKRLHDLSWCSLDDQGASFREVVLNFREAYHRNYIFENFRRHRYNWRPKPPFGIFWTLGKIFQHLFYRMRYEKKFRLEEGGFGYLDQYMAAVDTVNFFAEIIAQPDIGRYRLDRRERVYFKVSSGSYDIDLGLGLGKYLWSAYQEGLNGIFRLARRGVYLDKVYALLALSMRDWGLEYTSDERYYVNFYDLFPVEMVQLFGGLILDDPWYYGPRVKLEDSKPVLIYMDFWRGECSLYGVLKPCRTEMLGAYSKYEAIGDVSNMLLRTWASILSLAEFPIYTDPAFEDQLFIFVEGSGDGFDIPEGLDEGRDFVRYTSGITGKTYVAMRAKPKDPFDYEAPQELAITFVMVAKAKERKELLEEYRLHWERGTLPQGIRSREELRQAIDTLKRTLSQMESFFNFLIRLEKLYGVASYF